MVRWFVGGLVVVMLVCIMLLVGRAVMAAHEVKVKGLRVPDKAEQVVELGGGWVSFRYRGALFLYREHVWGNSLVMLERDAHD